MTLEENLKIAWKIIYLISQITFLFLTQIYYNMNFITLSSILPQDFPGTLRLVFADCFHKKCKFVNISAKHVLNN